MFRVVLQEKTRSPKSKAVEILGSYNPHTPERKDQVVLKEERIKYWLGEGAQPSNTMHNMLVEFGVIEGDKRRSVQPKLKPAEEGAEGEAPAEGGDAPKEDAPAAEEKKEEAPKEEKPAEKPEEKKEEAPAAEEKAAE